MREFFKKSDQHILLRFSDQLTSTAKDGTIKEHKKILKELRYVWMGKFGKKLGKSHIDVLHSQIKKGIPTVLFLVQTVNKEYDVYMAHLSDVKLKISKDDFEAVPEYYRKQCAEIGAWFKLVKIQKLSSESLKSILISSSGMPASHTLRRSMAGAFIVRLNNGISLKDL